MYFTFSRFDVFCIRVFTKTTKFTKFTFPSFFVLSHLGERANVAMKRHRSPWRPVTVRVNGTPLCLIHGAPGAATGAGCGAAATQGVGWSKTRGWLDFGCIFVCWKLLVKFLVLVAFLLHFC